MRVTPGAVIDTVRVPRGSTGDSSQLTARLSRRVRSASMRHEHVTAVFHPDGTFLAAASRGAGAGAAGAAIRAGAVLFVAVLTAAASQISVPLPFTPVPFTLQPMIVLLGGALLGPRLGACSQVLYLAAGLAGLPVFAASATLPQGAGRLLGPTGGYLMAYPAAAWVTGWLSARGFDRRYLTAVAAMMAGLAVILTGGVAWLASFMGGFGAAMRAGVLPFVLADIVKVCLAAAVLPALWRLTGLGRRSA
jgi:biotin transport system substrate-specific component